MRGELSAKEVGGKSRAESVRTRRNRCKKEEQEALEQGAESAKAAQKTHGQGAAKRKKGARSIVNERRPKVKRGSVAEVAAI